MREDASARTIPGPSYGKAPGSSECRIGVKADYVRDMPAQVSPHLGFFVYVVVGATLCGNAVSLAGELELLVCG